MKNINYEQTKLNHLSDNIQNKITGLNRFYHHWRALVIFYGWLQILIQPHLILYWFTSAAIPPLRGCEVMFSGLK